MRRIVLLLGIMLGIRCLLPPPCFLAPCVVLFLKMNEKMERGNETDVR